MSHTDSAEFQLEADAEQTPKKHLAAVGVGSGDWLAVFKATLKALEDAAADAGSYGPSEADEDYAKAIKDAKDFLANIAGQPRAQRE